MYSLRKPRLCYQSRYCWEYDCNSDICTTEQSNFHCKELFVNNHCYLKLNRKNKEHLDINGHFWLNTKFFLLLHEHILSCLKARKTSPTFSRTLRASSSFFKNTTDLRNDETSKSYHQCLIITKRMWNLTWLFKS